MASMAVTPSLLKLSTMLLNGSIIRGGGGADSIYFRVVPAADVKIYASSGSDTITFAADGSAAVVNTNEDNGLSMQLVVSLSALRPSQPVPTLC